MVKKNNTTGEPVTAQAPATTAATEDVVYYVLGEGGRDREYLVHIDLSVLERYRDAEIERTVTGTHHVSAILPERYDGEITTEVTVTLDNSGKISVYFC